MILLAFLRLKLNQRETLWQFVAENDTEKITATLKIFITKENAALKIFSALSVWFSALSLSEMMRTN